MVEASSSAMASSAVPTVKPTGADTTAPDPAAQAVANYGHVQAWMQAMKASAQTAEAILELPIGGPTAVT